MKKIAVITGCFAFALSLIGCSWAVPEKVSVKTNAEYNFALGNFEKDLNNELDISAMLSGIDGTDANVSRYDYFPGKENKNAQHFLTQVKVVEYELLSAEQVNTLFPNQDTIPLSSLSIPANLHDKIGLDFSPVDILKSLEDSMSTNIIGKVNFSAVPLYLYYEACEGLTANAKIDMFYGSRTNPIEERAGSKSTVFDNTVNYCARPEYVFEDETVLITDLEIKSNSAKVDIADVMNAATNNSNVQDNDQLCIEYTISSIAANGGSIAKSVAQNGIKIAVYALIDIPLSFDVYEDIQIKLSDLAGTDSSTDSTDQNASSESSNNEFSNYLDAVEGITIKYAAFKLPIYVSKRSGMQLYVDMYNRPVTKINEHADIYVVKEKKNFSDSDKSKIELRPSTIKTIQQIGNFTPNFELWIAEDTTFSIPRDKGVKVNLELALKTDGTVQVK